MVLLIRIEVRDRSYGNVRQQVSSFLPGMPEAADTRLIGARRQSPAIPLVMLQEPPLPNDNHGAQSGDHSLNVGVGDFRGANVNISHTERPTFTPEQLHIQRHPALGGRSLDSNNVSIFGYITGLASLIGLYFALFQPAMGWHSSWTTGFMFSFLVAVMAVVMSAVLRRRKFEHFLGSRHYLEISLSGRLRINRLTAQCPWCGSLMHLRHVGPKEGPRDDLFLCERNPRQHTIQLDPTALPELED